MTGAVVRTPAGAERELGVKENQILDAVLTVLARDGVGAASMRAVAQEAQVALGLINYYFDSKTAVIAAALRRLGDEDALIVSPDQGLDPAARVRSALRRVSDPEFLATDYLALRLQLWSLASVDPTFAAINREGQSRYLDGLADLIADARPDLDDDEVERRAADVLIIQNGMWLTSILIPDPTAVERSVERCEQIVFAD